MIFTSDIKCHANNNEQRAHNAQAVTKCTRGFKPIVLWVVKSLFYGQLVIGVTHIAEVSGCRNYDGCHCKNIKPVNEGGHMDSNFAIKGRRSFEMGWYYFLSIMIILHCSLSILYLY